MKKKLYALAVSVLVSSLLIPFALWADDCYKSGNFNACTSPGGPPATPSGWTCTPPVNEDNITNYEPDPTNKGFYVKTRGCRQCMICSKTGQRDQTVCGDEGADKTQHFQDGSCTGG